MLQKEHYKFFFLFILFILNISQIQNQAGGYQGSTQNQISIHFKAKSSSLGNLILLERQGIFTYNPTVEFTGYAGSITFETSDNRILTSTSETGLTSFNEIKEISTTAIFAKNYVYFLSNTDDSFKGYIYFDNINGDSTIFLPLDNQYCYIIFINSENKLNLFKYKYSIESKSYSQITSPSFTPKNSNNLDTTITEDTTISCQIMLKQTT